MGLISDVTSISVTEAGVDVEGIGGGGTSVTLSVESQPQVVQVAVAGPQGPPGLQNVYIQSNDPAVEFGWGPEEAGFVWIQV